jgi:hypothetical protein
LFHLNAPDTSVLDIGLKFTSVFCRISNSLVLIRDVDAPESYMAMTLIFLPFPPLIWNSIYGIPFLNLFCFL